MGSWAWISCAYLIFRRCQLHRIQSRIHSPCRRFIFAFELKPHHIKGGGFTRMVLTSYLILTGDWHARAQPRADGWDYEVGEEADYLQIQHQRTEYVSSYNEWWTVGSLQLVFLITAIFIVLEKLYGGVDYVDERHRHRFEVMQGFKTLSYESAKQMQTPEDSYSTCTCGRHLMLHFNECFIFVSNLSVEV